MSEMEFNVLNLNTLCWFFYDFDTVTHVLADDTQSSLLYVLPFFKI